MLTFCDGSKIPEWFGDFGGNFCVNDSDFARLSFPAEEYEKLLCTQEFERHFYEILRTITPAALPVKETQAGPMRVKIVPARARYYNMAGHLSLAVLSGAKRVFVGTFEREMALCAARACRMLGLELDISLSRRLTMDQELAKQLGSQKAHLDTSRVFDGFDLPYGQAEAPFERDPSLYPIPISANYGIYPKPGLTGMFAGLYGTELRGVIGDGMEAIVVPTDTGMEALGIFKEYRRSEAKLFTSEEMIAAEYHGCDTGTYTLIKKKADQMGYCTSLCPELAALWRSGRVVRLGCDRFGEVDLKPGLEIGLSEMGARALALAGEQCREIVVVEKEGAGWNA